MYSYSTMAGYSECDATGNIKISSLVNYLQNCSLFHSASIGFDIKHYQDKKKVWLLSSWQIEIDELPKHTDSFKICTRPYAFKGFFGMRNFWIENEEGRKLVKANSVWFYMDLEKGLPIKVLPEEVEGYGIEEKLDMQYEDRRIAVSKDVVFENIGEPIEVNEALFDTNLHVNNGHYIRIAYELLQRYGEKYDVVGKNIENAGFYPDVRQIRAEYIKAAKYRDVCQGSIGRDGNISYIKLSDTDGNVYAIVSFKCE